jgi:hypothetical protein
MEGDDSVPRDKFNGRGKVETSVSLAERERQREIQRYSGLSSCLNVRLTNTALSSAICSRRR